jgi:hypothetical protein
MNREELLTERARLGGVLDGLQNVDGKGVETYGPDAAGRLNSGMCGIWRMIWKSGRRIYFFDFDGIEFEVVSYNPPAGASA